MCDGTRQNPGYPETLDKDTRKEVKVELNPTHHQISMTSKINTNKKSAYVGIRLAADKYSGTAQGELTRKDINNIIKYLEKVEKELL